MLQMTRGEFLKQREEIGRIWKSQAPNGGYPSQTVSLSRLTVQAVCRLQLIILEYAKSRINVSL